MALAKPIRKKHRGNNQPGDPLPVPIASLTGFPSSAVSWNYYDGIYKDGVVTVSDLNHVASLWHNGYFGQLKNTNIQSSGSDDPYVHQKEWKLLETDGIKDASYFKKSTDPGSDCEYIESSDCEVIDTSDCEIVDNFEDSENKDIEQLTYSNISARTEVENIKGQKNSVKSYKEDKNVMREGTKNDLNITCEKSDQKDGNLDFEKNCRTILSFESDHMAATFFNDSNGDASNGYLELLLEEAMFLSYALGCLVVKRSSSGSGVKKFKGARTKEQAMTIDQMWKEFVSLDPNFVTRYAVYHHYRTKGWVVKSGLKFGAEFVLYPVGPPFYHAMYTVMIQCVWSDNHETDDSLSNREMSWTNIAATERFNTHVKKMPVICYVLRPRSLTSNRLSNIICLQSLTIEEVLLSRWDLNAANNVPEDLIVLD